jgi:hypothetical protein
MRVGILYVTFSRDIEWLRYSLESIGKYCTGFAGVTIVVPTWDFDKFLQFERYSTSSCPVKIKQFLEYPGRGFVHHLAMKTYADVFMPDMDVIIHMDPDCLFCKPTTPQHYTVGDKHIPVLVIEPYAELKEKHPARYNWKSVTEAALKFECTHETMCRHPAAHIPSTYWGLRNYMEGVHQQPFLDFVIRQKNSYPQGYGEFNTLGAYAMKFLQDKYYFIDREDKGIDADPEPHVTQMWSYTGVHKNMDQIKKILG